MAQSSIRQVAVIGFGTVGVGWTALFLANGSDVTVHDPAVDDLATLEAALAPSLASLRELGRTGHGRLCLAASPEKAVASADFVQENAPEKQAFKADLLRRLDEATPAGAIIASSTSSLLWSELTGTCRDPERVIVAHPFNPPHLVPLVELFGSDPAVLDRAEAFYAGLGMRPVRLKKEMRGHIANRLSSALYQEAVHLVEQGVASVAEIDAALRDGPGLRWATMGAHLTYHLGGGKGGIRHYLDHLGPSQERRWQDLGRPSLTDKLKADLVAGVEAEAAGRSIEELEALRDATLVALLHARRRTER
ncbi:3-hydroxyacyl-CoA dehydrogenase NAD-binding domain-containing protein [Geminicoccus roseus]|uniref:3-hydroxyacyl-CoA dehydrogenase NAD-binding domain-containing protein n=1 Tax=Geminicoccus roseus TaxID=404900 RepID=UPI00040C93D3|nr:3-hydroxyacyl-CoA dehydrogenase NAD-binding domain-containing protein [Geminicoccus roseus]